MIHVGDNDNNVGFAGSILSNRKLDSAAATSQNTDAYYKANNLWLKQVSFHSTVLRTAR